MKKALYLFSAIMILACASGAFAQSSGAASAGSKSPWSNLDLSKPETVSCYVVGSLGSDWQSIVDMANKLMKQKINTTVNFVYVPWSDFQAKYALFLAGGEDIDMIYGASWVNYLEHVKAGALKPINQDFLKKYMPLTWEKQAKSSWREATYRGNIYCVPNDQASIGSSGVITTKELFAKYGKGANGVKNWDDLKSFLFAVASGEKGTGTYAINPQGSWPTDVYWYTLKNHMFDIDAGGATWMTWDYDAGKPFSVDDMTWFADTKAYLKFALEMAEFNKAGVFPASVISNQSFINDNFLAGKSAINIVTPNEANGFVSQLKKQGKDLVYLDCLFDAKSHTRRGNYLGYGICFPVGSKRTERAAVALDCMKFDPEVNRLLIGGIEGKHYILHKEDNTRELGPEADKFDWNRWFYLIAHDSDPSPVLGGGLQAIQKRYEAAAFTDAAFPLRGFGYDSSKYQAQLAVLSSLVNEYRFSFCYGLFQDKTEAAYNDFIRQCRAAGLDNIVADYKAQLKAYLGKK
jgi:putative aldouronate transport system substrate-binding protein